VCGTLPSEVDWRTLARETMHHKPTDAAPGAPRPRRAPDRAKLIYESGIKSTGNQKAMYNENYYTVPSALMMASEEE